MKIYKPFNRESHNSPVFSHLDVLTERVSGRRRSSLFEKGLFQRAGIMNRLHCFKSFCRGISALALVSGLLFGMPGNHSGIHRFWAGPEDARPEIISIQLEVSEVVVTVRVPRGVTKVTLEGRSRLGMGNWAPRAVERVDGFRRVAGDPDCLHESQRNPPRPGRRQGRVAGGVLQGHDRLQWAKG